MFTVCFFTEKSRQSRQGTGHVGEWQTILSVRIVKQGRRVIAGSRGTWCACISRVDSEEYQSDEVPYKGLQSQIGFGSAKY